jgi:hypothetical protein
MLPDKLQRGIALLALAWISFAVQGCYTRVRVPAHPVEARRVAPDVRPVPREPSLEMSLSIEPVKFRIGDPVTLKIYVHNPHGRRIEIRFPSGCNVSYQVWDSKGKVVGPFRVCNAFGSTVGLNPDETRVTERAWPRNGRYFTSSGELVPGRYWIRGGFVWGTSFEGKTDAVMIEVLPSY